MKLKLFKITDSTRYDVVEFTGSHADFLEQDGKTILIRKITRLPNWPDYIAYYYEVMGDTTPQIRPL